APRKAHTFQPPNKSRNPRPQTTFQQEGNMRNALAGIIAGFLLFAVAGHLALGQDAQQQRQAITTRLALAKTFFDQMPPLQRNALSAAAQNFRNMAEDGAQVG